MSTNPLEQSAASLLSTAHAHFAAGEALAGLCAYDRAFALQHAAGSSRETLQATVFAMEQDLRAAGRLNEGLGSLFRRVAEESENPAGARVRMRAFLGAIAAIQIGRGDLQFAYYCVTGAFDIWRRRPMPDPGLAARFTDLGHAFRTSGEESRAIAAYRVAIRVLERDPFGMDEKARCWMTISEIEFRRGANKEASEAISNAHAALVAARTTARRAEPALGSELTDLAVRPLHASEYAALTVRYAEALSVLGQYDQAIDAYRTARTTYLSAGDRTNAAALRAAIRQVKRNRRRAGRRRRGTGTG